MSLYMYGCVSVCEHMHFMESKMVWCAACFKIISYIRYGSKKKSTEFISVLCKNQLDFY